jgi:hypothetical protein
MFLVEISPGIEAIYSSLSDFTEAIRRGEVGEQARIYHRTKSQWAPIAVHPVFRRVAAGARPSAALRTHWTFLPPEPGAEAPPAGQGAPATQPPAPNPAGTTRTRRWRGALGRLFGRSSH